MAVSQEQVSSPAVSDTPVPPIPQQRAVPCPRPGELLIYDCRPATLAVLGSANNRDSLLASATDRSSPPTPTPDLKNTATFTEQEPSFRNHIHSTTESPQESLQGANAAPTAALDNVQKRHNLEHGAVHGNDSVIAQGSRPYCSPTKTGASSSDAGVLTGTAVGSDNQGWAQSGAHVQHARSTGNSNQRPIRCLQWNIERNYKPAEILATLKDLDADILCIQEIDIGCHRSGYDRDHFLEMCQSQGLYGGFVPEFWELEHANRKDRDQGGGVHGNAILSKWPVNGFRVLDHVHHAYEWERDGMKLNEPRLGRRFTIVADIETPSGPLLCYCAHLEVFTGIVGRISALSDILADSELYSDRYPYQILFGDLNTISHSIARLAKTISTDQYRLGSFGEQEAEWWDRNLWSWHVEDGEFNLALASGGWSWLRRLGILGLGTGRHNHHHENEGSSTGWSTDAKYIQWLRKLVGSGLEKVKQARQQQLSCDTFVSLEQQKPLSQGQDGILQPSISKDTYDHDATGETESEICYQEDGSIILVGRPSKPSIVTLESTLMDRTGNASTATWSSPSMTFSHQYGSSDDEDFEKPTQQRGRRMNRDNPKAPRTPSTPSPTLRLIPPTPTHTRGAGLPDLTEQERGIPLECDDDIYDDFDYQSFNEHHYNDHSSFERQHYDSTTLDDNDFNDPPTTVMTTTETTLQDREHATQTPIEGDDFLEPLPPFLLSDLKLTHPFLATQRLWSGFTPLVLHQARNPGFYDPWSVGKDMTFHNPNFLGLLKAKLDFTLLMNLKCVGRTMGNHDYSASDHRWLLMEVEFEREFKTTQTEDASQEEDGEQSDKEESFDLPSKEQRYLWWREQRAAAKQPVQPMGRSRSKAVEDQQQGSIAGHRRKTKKQKHQNASSSSSSSFFAAATFTAIVAIGGAMWWSLRE
ncbi:MAG: hypothetical protein J3Q66DRAFT_321593 [Benniella sp.]|nr:MAG: hypothetical protein J3Q66DRAFT_321593 [Benniella sp.]